MLAALGPLPHETVLLLFTMVDRHDADSPWAPFWHSLEPVQTGMLHIPLPEQLRVILWY